MRFVLTQDIRDNKIIKTGVIWLIITSLVFVFFGTSYDVLQYGSTPAEITKNILGDPEQYQEPIPLAALILDTHIRLFLMLILTLVLFSMLFRAPLSLNAKIYWTNFTYVALLADSLSIYGIKYISSSFSYLKIASLCALVFSITTLCFYLLYFILKKKAVSV